MGSVDKQLTVGLLMVLFQTWQFWQLREMPSAHCWNKSDPQGPTSLWRTVTLLQVKVPSAMCIHDQLRGSNECTYSMSWSEFEPPISMFAPPAVGGAPKRVPLIYAFAVSVAR